MALEAISIIDLDTSQPVTSVVHAKQYDTVRVVEGHLYFSGEKWYVPLNNIHIVVSYKKSNHIGGFYDLTEKGITAVTVDADDRSIIYISLDREVVTLPGNVETEVTFYDTLANTRLSGFSFIVDVEEAAVKETDISDSPSFELLSKQMSEILEISDSVEQVCSVAEENLDGLKFTNEGEITGFNKNRYSINDGAIDSEFVYDRSRNMLQSEINNEVRPIAKGGTGISSNPMLITSLSSDVAANVFQDSPRPGVTGILPILNGGTGLTSNPSMLVNLGSTSADTVLKASPRPGVTGVLPVARGGTAISSAPLMLTNLASTSAGNVFTASPRPGVTGVLPIANGGTGSSTKNFVDLSNSQTVGGIKTFTSTIVVDKSDTTMTVDTTANILQFKYKNPAGNVKAVNVIRTYGESETGTAGNGIAIIGSSSGTTVVSSGESAPTVIKNEAISNTEGLYLIADGSVNIWTGANDPKDLKKTLYLSNAGNISVLGSISSGGSLGVTGNATIGGNLTVTGSATFNTMPTLPATSEDVNPSTFQQRANIVPGKYLGTTSQNSTTKKSLVLKVNTNLTSNHSFLGLLMATSTAATRMGLYMIYLYRSGDNKTLNAVVKEISAASGITVTAAADKGTITLTPTANATIYWTYINYAHDNMANFAVT